MSAEIITLPSRVGAPLATLQGQGSPENITPRAEFGLRPRAVCPSLLDAMAAQISLAAENATTHAAMLKSWGYLKECVAALEIASRAELLAAQLQANHTPEAS